MRIETLIVMLLNLFKVVIKEPLYISVYVVGILKKQDLGPEISTWLDY